MLTVAVAFLLALRQAQIEFPSVDPHIRYVGRWDYRDQNGPRAQWPASTVEIRFKGTQLSATFAGSNDYWVVEVDGKPTDKVQFLDSQPHMIVNSLPSGAHTVRLVKATEAFVGTGQVLRFSAAPGTKLLAIPAPKHRLEVIGDSISCGYGNEGANEKEHFKPDTENAYMSYGAIAARELHADFTDIAWSGRKMWPDNTIPSIYGLALPTEKDSTWGFGGPGPDAILINLATNDFGPGIPEEKGWTGAYSHFIDELRTHFPSARIYLAAGTMMSDAYPPEVHSMTTLLRYLKEIVDTRAAMGDKNCAVLNFGTQDAAKDGLGSDYHPNIKTHEKMAEKLVDTLRTDLHW